MLQFHFSDEARKKRFWAIMFHDLIKILTCFKNYFIFLYINVYVWINLSMVMNGYKDNWRSLMIVTKKKFATVKKIIKEDSQSMQYDINVTLKINLSNVSTINLESIHLEKLTSRYMKHSLTEVRKVHTGNNAEK